MTNPIPYAILRDGRCINRVLWDGDLSAWQPPAGCEAVSDPDNLHPIYREPVPAEPSDPLASLTAEQKAKLIALLQEASPAPKPAGWNPPPNPSRGTTYQAPNGSLWRWDQPRDPATGQFVADDPATPEQESALDWQPV